MSLMIGTEELAREMYIAWGAWVTLHFHSRPRRWADVDEWERAAWRKAAERAAQLIAEAAGAR